MKTITLSQSDYDTDKIITWCYINIGNGARFSDPDDLCNYPWYIWGYAIDFFSVMFIFQQDDDYTRFVLTWIG